MRVRYSFSCKHTGHIENIRKQRQKYPSVASNIVDTSDIILEVLDARFVKETRNKELEDKIIKTGKKIIYVFNKSDLIKDKSIKFPTEMRPFVFFSCLDRKGASQLRAVIKQEAKLLKKLEKRTLIHDKPRITEFKDYLTVGVIGYPNTGKSSVINYLIGKCSAPTASEAGFTKGFQKLKLSAGIYLIDSPGVIPNDKYSHTDVDLMSEHTIVGSRSHNQIKDPDIVIANLILKYPGVLEEFYGVESEGNGDTFLENFGRKRGFLQKGNEVNFDQASRAIIKDWQTGKIKF